MNKFWPSSDHVYPAYGALYDVTVRKHGDIPGILPAKDVFVERDGHVVIVNPSTPYRNPYAW
jgi:hypothetical protein